jgi:hypothetical protein
MAKRFLAMPAMLAAFVLLPPKVAAQSFAAGVGGGWARISCDVCQTARDVGPTAFVRIGTSLNSSLRVGAEATLWTHEVGEERENLGAAMAVLQVFPGDGPLHLKAGLGFVGYRAGEDIGMNAVGMQLGAGYDLRLGSLALTNYINVISSSFGNLKNNETTIANDVSATLLQLGVGLTLR